MLCNLRMFSKIVISVLVFLFFSCPGYAGELLNPVEDRELVHNNGNDTTIMRPDGQWSPLVKFDSGGNQEEGQVVMRYDLSTWNGLQFAEASLNFYVWRARHYETLSLDVMFYEGDGTVSVADFDRGTHYVGTYIFNVPSGSEEDYEVAQWASFDVTELLNNRNQDHLYFNIRLSGGYPDFTGNLFYDVVDTHHWINISAVENLPSVRPYLEFASPYVSAGPDRRVYGQVELDGSQSYDPGGDLVSYIWNLKCRGNSAYDQTATGVTAAVKNLKPGFYDCSLTVLNEFDDQAIGNFILFSGIGPQGDYNGDGDVDGVDLPEFAGEFGN